LISKQTDKVRVQAFEMEHLKKDYIDQKNCEERGRYLKYVCKIFRLLVRIHVPIYEYISSSLESKN